MEENDVNKLLNQLENEPKNLDLINQIAICYMRDYKICQNNQDYEYFKKAYNLKKTIKSTHNFANYLFHEYYNNKKALKIQRKCLELNPSIKYPYLLCAEILIEEKQYSEAIDILNKSQNIEYSWFAEYNLGFCKYMLGDYKEAEKHFLITSKDVELDNELKSIYGLALINYKLGKKEKVYKLLEKMQKSQNFDNAINNHDIGIIYFLYGDYENSKNNTIKCGLNIDFFDWKELGYALFQTDKEIFYKEVNEDIKQLKENIENLNNNNEDWVKELSDKEKEKYMRDYKKELRKKETPEKFFKNKPDTNIDNTLVGAYFGCSIFGCCIDDYLTNTN